MKFHELQPNKAARRERRRIGRGMGSGRGKTAGKGTKGQKARAGGAKAAPFIGGAFPLTRTMPYKKGFRSPHRVEYQLVKVRDLEEHFEEGAEIDRATLEAVRLVGQETIIGHDKKRKPKPIKLLSDGEVTKRFVVRVDRASAQARAKIEATGGSVEELLPRASVATATDDASDGGEA